MATARSGQYLLLAERSYFELKLRACARVDNVFHVYMFSMITCLQKTKLFVFGQAVRVARYHGFTNGLSKALSWQLVDIVTSTGLCDKHRLQSSLQSNPGQFPVLLMILVV